MNRFLIACLWLMVAFSGSLHAQTVVYIHTDALGSVVAETDANRTVLERREYEPYGQQLAPAVKNGPGYTGHVQDAGTGLVYMQQRYYDPSIGIFLSVDPVKAISAPIGYFNRFRYAAGNPYTFTDPNGECYTSTGKCMTPEEFDAAWKGEPARVLNAIGSPLGIIADVSQGDYHAASAALLLHRVPLGKQVVSAIGRSPVGQSIWRRGDDVYKAIKGRIPSWNTVRARFWKNESALPDASEKYGAENVERMRRGAAPQRYNADKGSMESMELSHEPIPARDGGKDFVPRWPQDHAAVDPFRRPGY